jgi:carbamate kinase
MYALRVQDMSLDGHGDLIENGLDVGVGHGSGVGDLLCQIGSRDGAEDDGLAVPLVVVLASSHLVLGFTIADTHNFKSLDC